MSAKSEELKLLMQEFSLIFMALQESMFGNASILVLEIIR